VRSEGNIAAANLLGFNQTGANNWVFECKKRDASDSTQNGRP
jgi:hypothetical protein